MIDKLFKQYDLELDASQIEMFGKFLKLFMDKNSQVNLSAIRDEQGIIEKHFVDSIILDKEIKLYGSILDIGTGGGFPGIPLAITNPDCDFTLLDSTRKKVDAVNGFISELGIGNARGVWGRAEEIGNNEEFRGKFDFVVSRATAYLPQILEWSLPFLKKRGMMIIYKLRNDDEIADGITFAKRKHMDSFEVKEYEMLDQSRVFIFVGQK